MNTDLKQIKKHYGEDMMHYARENFSIILEKEGTLSNLFLENFEPTKFLYKDLYENNELINFKKYIFCLFYGNSVGEKLDLNKSPEELLNEAGYELYHCKTEEEIQSFKKYYAKGEELCTFKGNRLNKCHVFFAVKKDVDKIKREDFLEPKRQDRYGTSVISIQFSRDETHSLSIKNRYNHTVNNPDATFQNNLDNIIMGLTKSFETYYNLKQKFYNFGYFEGFVRANDGKFYRYNYECSGIYYCPNNILIEYHTPNRMSKEKYILTDNFVWDLQKKEYAVGRTVDDSFVETIQNIKTIQVKKNNKNKKIIFTTDKEDVIVEINELGQIIKYINNNITEINDGFLRKNTTLVYFEANNVKSVRDNFLESNKCIETIKMDNVESIGNNFLENMIKSSIKTISLPKVKKIGNYFMWHCVENIEELIMPTLEEVGDNFLYQLKNNIKIIDFPNITQMGQNALKELKTVEYVNLPKIKVLPYNFMTYNKNIIKFLNIDNCVNINDNVLTKATINLDDAHLNNVEEIGDNFFENSCGTNEKLYLPKAKQIGDNFLVFDKKVKKVVLPNVKIIGKYFLYSNDIIEACEFENLDYLGELSFKTFFLMNPKKLKKIDHKEK